MAQLAVSAIGAGVGFAIGGPVGAQVGWMAGSIAGSMLFPPEAQNGPRIEDLKVTAGTYGEMIPMAWGTVRVPANVIWSSDLIEHGEEVGGKGFGGEGGKMFTYSVNVLLCVCESPYAKPRYPLRLWGNGRLIGTFNGTTWEVDQELIQRANVREYIGAADQEPDPVYEAAVGTENAPAYRGRLTVMLEGLQLADFGNRPPMFECEVTSELTVRTCVEAAFTLTDPYHDVLYEGSSARGQNSNTVYDSASRTMYVPTWDTSGAKFVEAWRVDTVPPTRRLDVPLQEWGLISIGGIGFDPENQLVRVAGGWGTPLGTRSGPPIEQVFTLGSYVAQQSQARFANTWDAEGVHTWGDYPGEHADDGGTGAFYGVLYSIYPGVGEFGGRAGEAGWWTASTAVINYRLARLVNAGSVIGWHTSSSGVRKNETSQVLYIPQCPEGTENPWLGGFNIAFRASSFSGYVDGAGYAGPITGAEGTPAGWAQYTHLAFSKRRRKVYVVRDGSIAAIDLDFTTGNPNALSSPLTARASILHQIEFAAFNEDDDGLLLGGRYSGGSGNIYQLTLIDPDTGEIIAGPCDYDDAPAGIDSMHWVSGNLYVGTAGQKIISIHGPGGDALGGGVPLSEIVGDVAAEVGFDGTDTAELTDIVPGFAVARQAPARSILELLRKAYFFGGVESGLSYVWRKRGKAAVATIEAGELGAHVFQLTKTDPDPAYELEHIEAIESPRELTLGYIDAQANYDRGTQIAARGVGASSAPAVLDLPIVLETDYAAQVAWTNLAMLHAAKDPIRLKLTHAREGLEPLDAINVPLANGEYVRVEIQQRTSARPLLEVEGVLEDPAIWDAVFPGVDRGQLPRQSTPAVLEDTVLEILDLPPLREADNRIVAYFAMSRMTGDAWPGGSAYRFDGGVNGALYSTSSEATIGTLVTSLPAWTKGNRWDRANRVQVRLRRGTLSSATELAVLNGANAAVIGNEIIQFANATLIGDGIWEIDTLLRHRIGTEWAALSDHAIGARFVLLTAAALRAIEYPLADLNVARTYRAVTSGQAIADGTSTSFTAIGNSVKPLAPAHVRGERDVSENLAVTWIRRARLNAEWRDDVDVPLDESSEKYGVYVFADATRSAVKRYEEVTTPAWAYTAADQTADFGSPQATVHLSIYQVTPTYGALGHAAEAAL